MLVFIIRCQFAGGAGRLEDLEQALTYANAAEASAREALSLATASHQGSNLTLLSEEVGCVAAADTGLEVSGILGLLVNTYHDDEPNAYRGRNPQNRTFEHQINTRRTTMTVEDECSRRAGGAEGGPGSHTASAGGEPRPGGHAAGGEGRAGAGEPGEREGDGEPAEGGAGGSRAEVLPLLGSTATGPEVLSILYHIKLNTCFLG